MPGDGGDDEWEKEDNEVGGEDEGHEDGNENMDEEEEEASGESSSAEIVDVPLQTVNRARRFTAGTNSTFRQGKAEEDHNAFWGHEEWADSSDDEEFEVSEKALSDLPDSSDSDFDSTAGAAEDAAEQEGADERKPNKGKLPLPGSAASDRGLKFDEYGMEIQKKVRRQFKPPPRPSNRFKRETTQQQTADSSDRAASREEGKAPSQQRRPRPPSRFTQQQRLEEAARTEEKNLADLRAMKDWEAESRRLGDQGVRRKRLEDRPRVRTVSKRGRTGEAISFVEFVGCDLPEVLRRVRVVPPPRARCVVTGLPARYRDPRTGQPFATAAAFAQLRGVT